MISLFRIVFLRLISFPGFSCVTSLIVSIVIIQKYAQSFLLNDHYQIQSKCMDSIKIYGIYNQIDSMWLVCSASAWISGLWILCQQ